MAIQVPDLTRGALVQLYLPLCTVVSDVGDNELLPALAPEKRYVVKELAIQNQSAVTAVVVVKSGTTAWFQAQLAAGASLVFAGEPGHEWRLGAGAASTSNST